MGMAKDRKTRSKGKRAVRSRADRDLQHLADEFNVSRQQIAGARRVVGSSRRMIAGYLAKRQGRG